MTALPNPFTTRPGAVKLPDQNVVARFRDPAAEQWALEAANALADLTHFEVVCISGPDRHQLLTTLSSQIITGLRPADSREFLLFDPHGHIIAAAGVIDDGEVTWAITDPGCGRALADHIMKMRFASRVEATLASELVVVGQVAARTVNHQDGHSPLPNNRDLAKLLANFQRGVTAHKHLSDGKEEEKAGHAGRIIGQWFDPWPGITAGGASYTPADFHHPASARVRVLTILERSTLEIALSAWEAGGGQLAGFEAWEALRVEDLRPRFATECDDRTVAAELDWLRTAVHLNKGCYCGQEAVARIINLGKPARRLVLLQLDGSQARLPHPGDQVLAGNKEVGFLTTTVRHADLGLMALALVRRGLRTDLELEVMTSAGPISAKQEVIVDPRGKSNVSPSQRPGAGLRRDVRGPVISKAPAKAATANQGGNR